MSRVPAGLTHDRSCFDSLHDALKFACRFPAIWHNQLSEALELWLHVWCLRSCCEACDSSVSAILLVCCRTAVSAADAQQDSEISDLQTVISLANETLFDLINATITANYTAQLDTLDTTYSDNTSDVSDFMLSACCCAEAVGILV